MPLILLYPDKKDDDKQDSHRKFSSRQDDSEYKKTNDIIKIKWHYYLSHMYRNRQETILPPCRFAVQVRRRMAEAELARRG